MWLIELLQIEKEPMKILSLTLFALSFLPLPGVYAQDSPLVRKDSIGSPKPASKPGSEEPVVPVEQWIGRRFVFAPRSGRLKQYAYLNFHVPISPSEELPYEKYVGRVARVTQVKKRAVTYLDSGRIYALEL